MSEENKPTPQSEADKEKELAAKRNAFLRYMTIIFAVAFLLVLISLVLQAHTAKAALSDLKESNSSALSNAAVNAELLQDENRKLQEELDSTKKLLADEQEKAKTQEESIAQLEQETERRRQALREAADHRAAIEARRNQTEKQAQEKNQSILLMERESARLEQKKATSELEEKQLLDKLWESYELTPSTAEEQAAEVENLLHKENKGMEISIINGGQPVYYYILSVE